MIKILLLFLLSLGVLRAETRPSSTKGDVLLRSHLRYFHKYKKLTLASEMNLTSKISSRVQKEFYGGVKYRLLPQLKLGLFYAKKFGLRHDNDWRFQNSQWQWQRTSSRGEDFLVSEVSPRYAYGKFLFELRIRDEHNFFNDQNTLRFRPSVNYFLMKDGSPSFNFFFQYETWHPINYDIDGHNIRERWAWLGAQYHYSKNLKIGSYLAYREFFWGTSQDFRNRLNGSYSVEEKAFEIGFFINLFSFSS